MPPTDQHAIMDRLRNPVESFSGAALRTDLRGGLDALPQWMRETVQTLLMESDAREGRTRERESSMNHGYSEVLRASAADRRDLFLGAPVGLERPSRISRRTSGFAECWTRSSTDCLRVGLGCCSKGTSLSKAYV